MDVDEVIHHDQLLNVTADIVKSSQIERTTDSSKLDTESPKIISIDLNDLHARMGHIAAPSITRLINNTEGYNKITNDDKIDLSNCEICLRSKFTNKINKSMNEHSFDELEKVSSDICGPIAPSTY
ncbi:hypothetical protein OnM2_023091 [Erysiphe neolycopersici]|uniref:GAG-pre-integrase domain-containing protein n=1 Tax=Erysiphe neolycopersici TaxID=212602 RepID=A0A420I238_9PEZI|nr:hypothetical protein OnM2_023091 [Erysiphe neolycopersici]